MAIQKPSAWIGWIYFASLMMIVLGLLQALAGLVAIFNEDFYLVAQRGLVVFNYTAWGWVHLSLGIIIICAGFALMTGRLWGRILASFLVVLNALANLAFLPAYPVWSIIGLIIDGLVLYAITVRGSEV